jgi:hypothetical protein
MISPTYGGVEVPTNSNKSPEEIAARRKAFIRKWLLKHRAVADSLEEAGDPYGQKIKTAKETWSLPLPA